MTVPPIGAVGADPAQAVSQMTQMLNQSTSQQVSAPSGATEIPAASLEMPSKSGQGVNNPSFTETVLDGVYNQIDKLSSKLPDTSGSQNAVDLAKKEMASSPNSINPMAEGGFQSGKDEAVTALSKTFDHAIFMAMVNQVVSGVSDTSRSLLKQS